LTNQKQDLHNAAIFVSGSGRYEQAKRFQRRSLKKNDEPEKRIAYIGHVFNGLGRNEESL
jgi:hypothetical protein